MTKLFSGLKADDHAENQDRVGGGRQILSSNAYDAIVKVAYVTESTGGATAVNVLLEINGQEVRDQQWVTNKNGENFFIDKEDKKTKRSLPGFVLINDLCLLGTGEDMSEQAVDTKTVKIYNFDEKKEVPTEVPVLVALTGAKIKVGILHKKEFKQKKDDSGQYVNTADVREINEVDKYFHPETGRTVNEYMHEVETSEFLESWLKHNKDKVRDRTAGASGGAGAGQSGSGRPQAAGAAAGATAGRKKLFGK